MDKSCLEKIKNKVSQLPSTPGVYKMLDSGGHIIYIGKAKNLKRRVSSYFIASKNKTEKVKKMVSNVADFEYILTNTELEAFNLEANLIKDNQPFYNIMLKDGKAYPFFKIDVKSDFPKVEIVRKVKNDGSKYFGPYFGTVNANRLFNLIQNVFCLRTCHEHFSETKKLKRECLNYHIGKCLAPCTGRVSKEQYRLEVNKVIDFFNGDHTVAKAVLTRKMLLCSEMEQYERAIEYREDLKMLQFMDEKMLTEFANNTDIDVFGYATNGQTSAVSVMIIRSGKMLGVNNYNVLGGDSDVGEVITSFLTQYYPTNSIVPNMVLVQGIEDTETLEQYIRQYNAHAHLFNPKIGTKKDLIKMSNKNASEYLNRSIEKDELHYLKTMGAMERLKKVLMLKKLPMRIEGYDISNISGTDIVSSMVVFENGEKSSKNYRKFKIKTVHQSNDFECMKETLNRRLLEYKKGEDTSFSKLPDLILIDGGKGQLGYAYQMLQQSGLDIDMISLAKKNEEIYVPHESKPIVLSKDDYALKLLQNVRDESHRFAITFHRLLRGKRQIKCELDNIKNLGQKRIAQLFEYFKNIENIKNASIEELCAVKGINKNTATDIYSYFHTKKDTV